MANTDKKSLWGFLFYIPYIRTRYKLYPHSLIHTSLNNAIPVTFTTLDNGQDIEWQIRREKINSFLFLFVCTYIRPHYDIFNHSLIQSLWTTLHRPPTVTVGSSAVSRWCATPAQTPLYTATPPSCCGPQWRSVSAWSWGRLHEEDVSTSTTSS